MTQLAKQEAIQWDDGELLKTIKETVCRGATDAQFRMFIEVCKATGLNPWLKEIWYVPNVGVMTARDGYLRVANDNPMFDGMETRVERNDQNIPIKATCTVWRKDRKHPVICEAYYSEYKKAGNVWNTYPSAMISKVAEVLALKRSFSINGVVTQEEIGNGDDGPPQETQAEVLKRKLKPVEQMPAPLLLPTPDEPPPARPLSELEQRHNRQIIEANQILDDATKKPVTQERRKGSISFKALGEFKVIKDALYGLTDTDKTYYEALAAAGVKHANELDADTAKTVWKSLAAMRKRLQEDAELHALLQEHTNRMGEKRYFFILSNHGCETTADAMNLNGTALQALLDELKAEA